MLFVMGVSLYTSRVVLAELGVTDYGIYNVVGSVVTIFTFISQALGNATNRFIVFSIGEGDVDKTKRVYNTCFRVHLIIAAIVVLLLETAGLWFLNGRLNIPDDRHIAALFVFHISVIICFLSILRVPSNAEVIAHEHMGVFALISVVEVSLKLLIAIMLIISTTDKLILYAFLLLVVQIIVNLSYHVYCKRKFEECKLTLHVENDKRLYKEISSFAGWSMFGNVVWLGYTQGMNLMLNIFFGPAVNAARGVAVQVESAVTSFVSSFQTALNPQITKSYAQGDIDRMHSLIVYSSKFSVYLYLMFAVPIFFEAKNILEIWLVEVPDHTVNFVRLILIFLLLTPIGNPLGTSNDATGKIRNYQIVCGLINLQIIVVSYIFLRMGYAPEVVFVIQIIVFSIQNIAKLLFVHKQVKLSLQYYFRSAIIPVFIVCAASVLSSYLLLHLFSNNFVQVTLFMAISFFTVLFIEYLLGLNMNERIMVKNTVKKYCGRMFKYKE